MKFMTVFQSVVMLATGAGLKTAVDAARFPSPRLLSSVSGAAANDLPALPAIRLASYQDATPPFAASEATPPKAKPLPKAEPPPPAPVDPLPPYRPSPSPAPAPLPSPPAGMPAPQLYTATDVYGRVWTHSDPNYLSQWVAAQAPPVVYQSPRRFGLFGRRAATCVNGQCGP